MSHQIVIGIDHSASGERAVATGAGLARDLARDVVLAHVLHAERPTGQGDAVSMALPRELGSLRDLADQYGVPAGTRVALCQGDPVEELITFAEAEDAELLVVGSRGLHELGDALLGSVSSSLMRAAPCPVVVAPPAISVPLVPASGRPVVCGVEGSDRDRPTLRLAADLARRLGAPVHAVHAFAPRPVALGPAPVMPPLLPGLSKAAEARLDSAVAEAGVEASKSVVDSPVAKGLMRAAQETGAGLLVIGAQGHGRLGSLLLGSVAIQLTGEAPIPVVVRPPGVLLDGGSGHYELADSVS
jgi:nucleotide-binding universal stress UspA family protein